MATVLSEPDLAFTEVVDLMVREADRVNLSMALVAYAQIKVLDDLGRDP